MIGFCDTRGERGPPAKDYVVDVQRFWWRNTAVSPIQAGEQQCIQLLFSVMKNYVQSKVVNSEVQVQCSIQPQ